MRLREKRSHFFDARAAVWLIDEGDEDVALHRPSSNVLIEAATGERSRLIGVALDDRLAKASIQERLIGDWPLLACNFADRIGETIDDSATGAWTSRDDRGGFWLNLLKADHRCISDYRDANQCKR